MSADKLIIVLVTAPNEAVAQHLAEKLIEARVAACVSILPGVNSIYRWEGKVERAQENLLLIKTTKGLFDQVEAEVRANHPYDTPEIVALKTGAVFDRYLKWAQTETKPVAAE